MAKEKVDMQAATERTKDPLNLKEDTETVQVHVRAPLYNEAAKYRDKYEYTWREIVEKGLEHFIEVCKKLESKKGA